MSKKRVILIITAVTLGIILVGAYIFWRNQSKETSRQQAESTDTAKATCSTEQLNLLLDSIDGIVDDSELNDFKQSILMTPNYNQVTECMYYVTVIDFKQQNYDSLQNNYNLLVELNKNEPLSEEFLNLAPYNLDSVKLLVDAAYYSPDPSNDGVFGDRPEDAL